MSVSVMSKATRKEGVVAPAPPDPEVPERPTRRKFTAEYKLAILKEVDLCTAPGEIGAILRRRNASVRASARRSLIVVARASGGIDPRT